MLLSHAEPMNASARLLAYYLPQFHPIPENDEWWGKGFTEWTNVAKAKPLFRGHWQPRLPADLGFYDLRVPEVREAQAELARANGIEGFVYYHYWFGNGRQLLERPINEVVASGKPDFPFSLCWANETWKGIWFGDGRTLVEQTYGGKSDIEKHFEYLLPIFSDPRYITVDGKPMFQILTPSDLPDSRQMTDSLRELAHRHGFPGLYIVAGYRFPEGEDPRAAGFDASVASQFASSPPRNKASVRWLVNRILHSGPFYQNRSLQSAFKRYYKTISYSDLIENLRLTEKFEWDNFPCVMPNWDNTPRSGARGLVVFDSTPEKFAKHLEEAIEYVQEYQPGHRIVFIKSWNEWAEGNYLEPDTRFGHAYLHEVKRANLK
jgi:hypothetical protein